MATPAPSIVLKPPPDARDIDLTWLNNNREMVAQYMAAVYAMANGQVVVIKNGQRLPAQTIRLGNRVAIWEITV